MSSNLQVFYEGLKLMGFGMTGIFVVLLMLYGAVKLLFKLFPAK